MQGASHPIARSLAVLVLVAGASCSSRLTEPPEIAPPPDAKTTDLVFLLASHERRPDGSQLLSASGKLQGRPVGFDLELAAWQENPPGYINMSTWECKATLRSLGAPGDELLRFMAELYGTGSSRSRMVASAEVKAFSPWKNPGGFEDGGSKFLLLFPSSFEIDQPAEVWIEIDTDERRIVLREKEPRLRRTLIDALSASV